MPNPKYETDDFRIIPPAERGGEYLVQVKADGTTIAVMCYVKQRPVMRRWKMWRPGTTHLTPWKFGATMMELAKYAYTSHLGS